MPETTAAKILVADDDQSLVRTLTWILKENGYDVVTAPGGEGLIGRLEEERPHLLLLDIMMPKVDGLQLLAKMKADDRFRDVPVLMISSMPPEEATVKALGLCAADFTSKPFRVRELLARVNAHIRSAQELAHAVHAVSQGVYQFDASVMERMIEAYSRPNAAQQSEVEERKTASLPQAKTNTTPDSPGAAGLTNREVEILRLIATGATNREVADYLVISEGTVKNHLSNIFSRLGLRDRTQAVMYARERGLL